MPYFVTAVAMGYTRQSVAIGLMCWAITALLDRATLKFIIIILIATLFHKTAIFSMLLLLTCDKESKKYPILMLYIGIPLTITLIAWVILKRWETYIGRNLESHGAVARMVLNIIPALIFFFSRRKWEKLSPQDYSMLYALSIFTILLFPLAFFISSATDRTALYLAPLQLIFYGKAPEIFSKFNKKLTTSLILIFYSAIYLEWLYKSPYAQRYWIPYHWAPFSTF